MVVDLHPTADPAVGVVLLSQSRDRPGATDAFERGAREVSGGRAARDPGDGSTCALIPVRGAEPRERGYERDAVGRVDLARDGGSVVGTSFTVNPGGDLGPVGSGASWRQIIDLAQPERSVGVYPGGQSENPASPHYADQMKLWARGQYLPLDMLGESARLPASSKSSALVFKP